MDLVQDCHRSSRVAPHRKKPENTEPQDPKAQAMPSKSPQSNGKENGNYYSILGFCWDNGNNGNENGNYYSILGLLLPKM